DFPLLRTTMGHGDGRAIAYLRMGSPLLLLRRLNSIRKTDGALSLMGKLENSTITMTFFVILLIAYGTTVGGANVQNSITNLFAPWPTLSVIHLNNCQLTDLSCNTANIVIATAMIAGTIEYPAILFFN